MNLVNRFENLKKKIERVPPDVEAYLQEEHAAIFDPGPEWSEDARRARLRLLMQHNYYYAWKLHKALDEVIDSGSIQKDPFGPKLNDRQVELIKYARAQKVIGEVEEPLGDYIEFDDTRTPSVFSSKDVRGLYFMLGLSSWELLRITECAIERLYDEGP